MFYCYSVTEHDIAINICTCHDSCAVMTCANFFSNHSISIWISYWDCEREIMSNMGPSSINLGNEQWHLRDLSVFLHCHSYLQTRRWLRITKLPLVRIYAPFSFHLALLSICTIAVKYPHVCLVQLSSSCEFAGFLVPKIDSLQFKYV